MFNAQVPSASPWVGQALVLLTTGVVPHKGTGEPRPPSTIGAVRKGNSSLESEWGWFRPFVLGGWHSQTFWVRVPSARSHATTQSRIPRTQPHTQPAAQHHGCSHKE